MVHYHVWFNLKPDVPEAEALARVRAYFAELVGAREAVSFQLLQNCGAPPRSRLHRFHALVEFSDQPELGRAMKSQAQRGVHAGRHGAIIEVVSEFQVEIFETMPPPAEEDPDHSGCQI